MKKITILGILALVIMPIFSDAMEQKRKPEFQKGNRKVTKKRKIGEDSSAQNACGWDDCPEEIKMHILYFVIDANGVMNAIAAKDKKAIFKFIKQWRSLLSVNKDFNSFALDKQVLKIGEINVALLEKNPDCFFELLKKSLKSECDYFFKLPSFIVIPPNEGCVVLILAIASREEHTGFCRTLIDSGISDYVAENTPLIHAIYLRNHFAVKKLIGCGKCKARLKNGLSELAITSMVGDSAIVKMLLKVIPNSPDGSCYDASLMHAIAFGNKEIAALLLDRGASVGQASHGFTALMLAASNGHNELVELLIDKGAEFNKQSSDGRSALMFAAQNGHREVVQLLLDKGAEFNKQSNDGRSALMLAAENGHQEVVRLLLDRGADVNQVTTKGFTALMLTANHGHKEILELLLANGAEFNKQSNDCRSALMLAAQNGHQEVVRLLLATGIDIDQVDYSGNTALIFAAYHGHREVVQLLLDYHADVNKQNQSGQTALSLATQSGNKDIANLLMAYGAK